MREWERQKADADRFLPEARRVIAVVAGELIQVEIATTYEDRNEATDLVVDNIRAWSWRLRFPSCKYRDFTIRSALANGSPDTELAKLLNGYGDFYLYSWTDVQHWERQRFSEWAIINLDTFRTQWVELDAVAKKERNKDGGSSFLAWPIGVLQDQGVVARSKMRQMSLQF